MAKKDKKKEVPSKNRRPISVHIAIFIMLVASVVFLSTTLVFIVGMVPSFVAFFVDRSAQKSAGLTVSMMNIAGVIPSWLKLWENGRTMEAAVDIVFSPVSFMLAYGCAGIGWILYYNIIPLVSMQVVRNAERRVRQIDTRLKQLLEKWGTVVSGRDY